MAGLLLLYHALPTGGPATSSRKRPRDWNPSLLGTHKEYPGMELLCVCNDRSSHSRILLGLYVEIASFHEYSARLYPVVILYYLATTDNYHIIPMIGTYN